ncbi:MAG: S8 family serine peptidase [Gammaproteobacteria bacterium]|nr:S8 family serine peptidase [Gammaproteobacteria bacterium]
MRRKLLITSLICVCASVASTQLHQSEPQYPLFSTQAQLIPRDPLYTHQRDVLSQIGLEAAWDVSTGDETIIVAVIDDAIDIFHSDLVGNLVEGFDFVDGDSNPSPDSADRCNPPASHGTAMAGIIGAVGNNNKGMSGIAWNVKIMPLRIGCSYSSSLEAQAINYALSHGADIINMSYGGATFPLHDASYLSQLANANALFIAAAGNFHSSNDILPMYPADLDMQNMLSVAAVDQRGRLTSWSQYGATHVDIGAPGEDIFAIDLDNDSYSAISGTSAATAVTSGVAALIKSVDLLDGVEDLQPVDMRALIMSTVSPVSDSFPRLASGGNLHAYTAMQAINQRKPVLVIKSWRWKQESLRVNGVPDSGETGVIELLIENIGESATNIEVDIASKGEILKPVNSSGFISRIDKGVSASVEIPAEATIFSGHRATTLNVDMTALYAGGVVDYRRGLPLQSGILNERVFISSQLRQNPQDEMKYFQANSGTDSDSIVFELAYPPQKGKIGLAISKNDRPSVKYNAVNDGNFTVRGADRVKASGAGVERVGFPVSTPENFHIAVFDMQPSAEVAQTPIEFDLRVCHLSANEPNSAPNVNAGADMEIKAGSTISLKGLADDPDGDIRLLWWDANTLSDVTITDSRSVNSTAQFPVAGLFELTLHASDNACAYAEDTMVVFVKDDNQMASGLGITPPNYNVTVGGVVETNIQGQINGQGVRSLSMIYAPPGVTFDSETRRLTWSNAGPPGDHKIRFSGTSSESPVALYGEMTISVYDRTTSRSGVGGCSVGNGENIDPFLILLVLFPAVQFLRKARIRA